MTLTLLKLEDFASGADPDHRSAKSATEWEAERSAAFAEGFESGRNFAARERDGADAETRREIAQALQELDFAHVAARRHVLASLDPLMRQIASVLLPELASAGLADLIAAEVQTLALHAAADRPRIVVGEDRAAPLLHALSGRAGAAPDIVEDPALGPLEARVCTSQAERDVDPGAAVASLAQLIVDFLETTREAQANG